MARVAWLYPSREREREAVMGISITTLAQCRREYMCSSYHTLEFQLTDQRDQSRNADLTEARRDEI